MGQFRPMAKHKATYLSGSIALQASGLPEIAAGEVPEWVHILPAGAIMTNDGRGPYELKEIEAVLQASMEQGGGRLVIDENHATDAETHGATARAAGWMVALEARKDGIWAQVEWTDFGKELVEGRAYRGISPVIMHTKENEIGLILRAALTNNPNLLGLTSLHNQNQPETETIMELSVLISLLGLEEGATEEDVTAAIKKLADTNEPDGDDAAMQSALTSIAAKLGKDVKADSTAICSALDTVLDPKSTVPMASFTALQNEVVELRGNMSGDKAEAAIDAAIKAGKPGVKPSRDHFIALHKADPEGTDKMLAGMPSITGSQLDGKVVPHSADEDGLGAEDRLVMAAMGVDPEAFKKARKAEAAQQEAL